jgi:hypothetical protein
MDEALEAAYPHRSRREHAPTRNGPRASPNGPLVRVRSLSVVERHDAPHVEAVDPPVKAFHTFSLPRTPVNSPSSDAPGVVGWHHRCKG